MKPTKRDYAKLTAIAGHCGLVPWVGEGGVVREGFFSLPNLNAPIDLTACAEDEKSVYRTALRQLSQIVDSARDAEMEKRFHD